jgi:hypothetical protein
MIAVDTSASTRSGSGIDVDKDGEIGLNPVFEFQPNPYPPEVLSTDRGDTILAAELSAVCSFLNHIPSKETRVGIVTFAGDVDPDSGLRRHQNQEDAFLESPLTHDLEVLRMTLSGIAERGSSGATNYAAAISLAMRELSGGSTGKGTPHDEAAKVLLFVTDGIPTLPFGKGTVPDPEDTRLAIITAEEAAEFGIRIHMSVIGPNRLAFPEASVQVAKVTGGLYIPLSDPDGWGRMMAFMILDR